ncbi:hypothetical protein HD806DRAFT_494452 [Xylariaceae sp. AK1471]|nr:hypothetical protein HD806DRAFT_494452 [Xylariaceae sp. AK1471]
MRPSSAPSTQPLGDRGTNGINVIRFGNEKVACELWVPADENAVSAPKKRNFDTITDHSDIAEVGDDDPRLDHYNDTPQQTRRKIRDFIDGGNMKVGEFQKAIGVGSTSYQRFMSMIGTHKGELSDTYPRAARFFKKLELQGLKAAPPPRAKKAKTNTKEKEYLDVSGIHLQGEETKQVPVFDTCDEVRKKIRAVLRHAEVSQAALCRTITAECLPNDRKLSSTQLASFLGKEGSMSGNTSIVFYGSYVFLEKRRLKEGKPKSKFREEMERIHPNGVDTDSEERYWTCRNDERPYHDKYGVVHFT